jgi:hypothetical protein
MIAAALTSIVLGTYEFLRRREEAATDAADKERQGVAIGDLKESLARAIGDLKESLARQFALQNALMQSAAKIEVITGPEDLYSRATTLVQNTTVGPVLSSDLRFTDRKQQDQGLQVTYIAQLCEHLAAHPLLLSLRAISARTSKQCEVLKTVNAPMFAPNLSRNMEVKFYPRNPIAVDIVVGDGAALLAFQDFTGVYSTGLLISDSKATEKLREWFMKVIWKPDHLLGRRDYLETIGPGPFRIHSADKIDEIRKGIEGDEAADRR